MKFVFIILITILLSCSTEPEKKYQNLVFLGDSLITGYGLKDKKKAFPNLVKKKLKTKTEIFGIDGLKSTKALEIIDRLSMKKETIYVLSLTGGDTLRTKKVQDVENNLRKIFTKLRYQENKIILLGVHYNNVSEYREMFKKVCSEYKIILLPNILKKLVDKKEFQEDFIHPNENGHETIATLVLDAIKNKKDITNK